MTFDFAAARQNMVESQVRPSDVTDTAIQSAMRTVAREALCSSDKRSLAYADMELPASGGGWLMRPRDAAKLLQTVRPRPGERALAIAAPYLAAVLEAMGLQVERLGSGDLQAAPSGSYDLIVSEGAVASTPASWLKALAPGGRLGVVERSGPVGKARLYVNADGHIGAREVFDSTPPFLDGFEPRPQFAF